MTKKLFEIIDRARVEEVVGNDVAIEGFALDSRKIQKNYLFAAFKGSVSDGHQYIDTAITNGAVAVLCETRPENLKEGISYIVSKNARLVLGDMLSKFHELKSKEYKLVGVTGTNGKTTVATLLYQLFSKLGYKCGLISTVENIIGTEKIASTHTTPDVVSFHQLLNQMIEEHCTHIFMEVSSHAIDQDRIASADFKIGIFTNISHDHLDYHKTYKNYINAKKKFFDGLPRESTSIVNIDDKVGKVMVQNTKSRIKTYALRSMADYKAKILEDNIFGLNLDIAGNDIFFKLSGEFNAYNLLAVYATSMELGEDSGTVLTTLSSLQGASGRFEKIYKKGSEKLGIVDYAHTPDALENVLVTIKEVVPHDAKIITVVGCGGDRDRTKRPEMASIACQYSDKVILTSDNPRSENPQDIVDEMMRGVKDDDEYKVLQILDRKSAIQTAVSLAGITDCVLVAGKGHEDYQEINGVKHHFDDREVIKEVFEMI